MKYKLQLMTTGRGLMAGRLRATCALFVRADYAPWAEESDDGLRTSPRPVRGHPAASAEPTAGPPTAPGR